MGTSPEVVSHDGSTFRLPAPPMQFGGEPPQPKGAAPEFGQHTEEILLELGHDWRHLRVPPVRRTRVIGVTTHMKPRTETTT